MKHGINDDAIYLPEDAFIKDNHVATEV